MFNVCMNKEIIYIYDFLILNKYVRPTALDKWQDIYCIEENAWSDISKLNWKVFHLTLCTKYHAKMAA